MDQSTMRQQTLAEACAALHVSLPTLQRWLKLGAPCDRLGRNRVRVSAPEIQAWLVAREAQRSAS
jgi:predicted site-specific integrase-resolvase